MSKRILVWQTAFLGDVILTEPLVATLHERLPAAIIDVMIIPVSADVFSTHPDVSEVLTYDKRNSERGLRGIFSTAKKIKKRKYDIVYCPHRSLRSALVLWLAHIPKRISFTTSVGKFLFTETHAPRGATEVEKNLSLVMDSATTYRRPQLYLTQVHEEEAHKFFPTKRFIALAPGSVWATKRWLPNRFAELINKIEEKNFDVLVVGGKDDEALCERVIHESGSHSARSAAGKLSVLGSAALISHAQALVANDSAAVHLATAVGTPVVAIFGPTVPAFGFAPQGNHDKVIQHETLSCRPCAIHGGNVCPIGTHECMSSVGSDRVFRAIEEIVRNGKS